MAVLGEEGDGKTWCVASWLSKKLQEESEFPPALFLSSEKVSDNKPLELLSNYFEQESQGFSKDAWKKRVRRWMTREHNSSPILILVLDGINERRNNRWWRTLLEQFRGQPWANQIAVLMTCRQAHWERYFSGLKHLKVSTYSLLPYSDTELAEALACYDLKLSDINGELFPLIRNPRYFDLMIKYRDKIQSSGDITRARLIYEDWQHKYFQKNNLELSPEGFQQVISDLSKKYIDGERFFSDRKIDGVLPILNETIAAREELRTGKLFEKSTTGHSKINKDYLVYGLALLLVEELGQAYELAEKEVEDVLSEWLEPHAEMDLKSSICEFATLHALSLEEFPEAAKVALLHAWISSRNPSVTIDEKFGAYLPQDPQAYLALCEIVWLDTANNPWAQELLVRAFLRWWHDAPDIQPFLKAAFKRWLGYVSLYGFPAERRVKSVSVLQQKVFERIGSPIQVAESLELGKYTITGIEDDGLLRLGRVALAIISHLPRIEFIHEISTGLLADELMGVPAKVELISWILHTASEEIWDAIDSETDQLLLLKKTAANKTAYSLLTVEGSYLAERKRQSLPEGSYERNPMQEQIRTDP